MGMTRPPLRIAMTALPPVNLVVVQPAGYVHSLGLLDPARYFRWQFERMGARATISKNRLVHGAVNFVFGAHLGFDAELCQRHTCVFVNLEQLGAGGAALDPAYLALLRRGAVVDYHADNVEQYAADPADVPIVSMGYAPYVAPQEPLPLSERPIDLLFFGSLNDRRRELIRRIEATGRQVSIPSAPVYGPERDALIANARAVLNCHFYDAARFEQVRAFQALSLGTPVVSERVAGTEPPAGFDQCVTWFDDATLEDTFSRRLPSSDFDARAAAQLKRFRDVDPVRAFAHCLNFAIGVHSVRAAAPVERQTVRRLHIGSGKSYRPGWFNIDVQASTLPDALLDLSSPTLELPVRIDSTFAGPTVLEAGHVDEIVADNVLEHVPDLPRLMTNCLALLRDGGRFLIDVPYERASTAWQDPTHVRAMNENSWLYYTDWFWYLGWFEHRFDLAASSWLDLRLQPCAQAQAAFMRVELVKRQTTMDERTAARTFRADFGPDLVLAPDCA